MPPSHRDPLVATRNLLADIPISPTQSSSGSDVSDDDCDREPLVDIGSPLDEDGNKLYEVKLNDDVGSV